MGSGVLGNTLYTLIDNEKTILDILALSIIEYGAHA